jgi:hypothetical protein
LCTGQWIRLGWCGKVWVGSGFNGHSSRFWRGRPSGTGSLDDDLAMALSWTGVGGVDEDVGVLRGFDRVEKVVCAGVFFAVAEDDEDSAALVDQG